MKVSHDEPVLLRPENGALNTGGKGGWRAELWTTCIKERAWEQMKSQKDERRGQECRGEKLIGGT